MARAWSVSLWTNSQNATGNASGEFPTLAAALDFADNWMMPGWRGEITHPDGRTAKLERGLKPVFPKRES